jgi:hypothetical protein
MRAIAAVMLSAVLAAGPAVSGVPAAPLAVTIAPLEMATRGVIPITVAVARLRPSPPATVEATVVIAGRVITVPPVPVAAARVPGELDLPDGRFRLGGVTVWRFPPVPPPDGNTAIALAVTVRQAGEAATARRSAALLLPTVIVPGYLEDVLSAPDPRVLAVLRQRGYRSDGASPTMFWFVYPSRRFSLQQGAEALGAYVRQTVLPSVYAGRINVVGFSEGGLLVRWELAFDPSWSHLVNRFIMIGTPNEGSVASYVFGWYPVLARVAATPAARDMLPTYPFWRPSPAVTWSIPPEARNASLARLNAQPPPDDVQVYAFFGTAKPGETWAGVTGAPPDAQFSYGAGDGIVLAASVLGLPINGGAGIPGFSNRLTAVNLGPVRHLVLLRTAITKIADVLTAPDVKTAPH